LNAFSRNKTVNRSSGLQPVSLEFSGRTSRQLALAIVALGFGLRLFMLASESLWYDELLQLDIAQGPLTLIFPRLRGHSAVPLDYLIGHFWISLGRDDGWVRVPAVIAGTLALPLAYQLGRWLIGRVEGLLFMIILALSPFHIHFSQEVRPYALVVLGVMLAVWAMWRMRQTGQWRYFMPLQLGVLIFLMAHIFAAAILVSLLIFLALDFVFSRNRQRVLQVLGALLFTGLLPAAVFVLMGWGDVVYYSSIGYGEALIQQDMTPLTAGQPPKPITGPKVDWPFIRERILAFFASSASLIPLAYFNGLVILGLVYLLGQRRLKLALVLSLWVILPPLIIVTFLILRDTFFAPRYIISIVPAYFLLLAVGLLAIPRWLKPRGSRWLSLALFLILFAPLLFYAAAGTARLYRQKDKENWHLVADFITDNAKPKDAVIAFRAEPTMNWYYRQAWTPPNYFENLESVQAAVARAERSWVILSLFSSDSDARVKAWLGEQQAVRFVLDPIIHVYYLGSDVPPEQLLTEIQSFALPVDHALYASLARENRRRPEVARQYYQLAIEHAPDAAARLEYETALEALARQ
jgi:uncharacterized membrane protein